ncbi:SRPBCC domain-containing protein [Chitinophaga niabensis]|uniref:SRPBCC domain-containing protein n=1 Tax=Chitinophaga niabensis TaxID=536979 RepID=UPI0031BA375F
MKKQRLLFALAAILLSAYSGIAQEIASQKKSINENSIKSKTMETQSYTATITVDKSQKTAFNAVKNFRGWWSEEIEGPTDKLNEVFVYHYKDVHICKMKLIEYIPDKKLVYQVLDNQFSFINDKSEWIGTKLVFDISNDGGKTKVKFTHVGLVPEYECYKVCFDAWGNYINNSLHSLIATGEGKPNPKGKDGFNAELADKWKIKH